MTNPHHLDYSTIELSINEHSAGRTATVSIDNQKKCNAISPAVCTDLHNAFSALASDDQLRAVVLRGSGDKAFAAGADTNALRSLKNPQQAFEFITNLHLAINAVRTMPVPVVCRLHGYCFGAAMELAAACDFRAGDNTLTIGMPEVRIGIPSVIEAALLPRLIGWGKTREILLTGANYSAQQAADMGFIQALVPEGELDAQVNSWIEQILACGQLAVRSQKALLAKWEDSTLDASIAKGIEHFSQAFLSDEPGRMMDSVLKQNK